MQQDFSGIGRDAGASVQTFVRDQLQPTARVVVHAVPGNAGTGCATPSRGREARRRRRVRRTPGGWESINADEAWRNQAAQAGCRAHGAAADADIGDAVERA